MSLELVTFAQNAGSAIMALWRNILRLDERTPPKYEDGWTYNPIIAGTVLPNGWGSTAENGGYLSTAWEVMNIRTGSTTDGKRSVYTEGSLIQPSRGSYDITHLLELPFALAAGDEFSIFAGASSANSGGAKDGHADAYGFLFDESSTLTVANWMAVAWVGGTKYELKDTGIPFASGEKRFFRTLTAKDNSSLTFQTKLGSEATWTTVHVETTNIPTNIMDVFYGVSKENSTGTATKGFGAYAPFVKHERLNA